MRCPWLTPREFLFADIQTETLPEKNQIGGYATNGTTTSTPVN
jgi:hypothetical protein